MHSKIVGLSWAVSTPFHYSQKYILAMAFQYCFMKVTVLPDSSMNSSFTIYLCSGDELRFVLPRVSTDN